jgi:hypothetical protein
MDARRLRVGIEVSREFTGVGKLLDGYRPELHYMRGPGPRWHEKHDRVPAAAPKDQHEHDYALWLVPTAVALLGVAAAVALA